MQLETLSAVQIGDLVNKGEVSPVEVIRYFAQRIDTLNPKVNAFTYTKVDEAIKEAEKLELRILKGEYGGPFAGVPVGLKDFLNSKKGWSNTHGGVPALKAIDTCNSRFYSAAKKLGAIAIGKTNAPPFGFKGTCDNTMYGPTHNPYNLEYNSGGSSGGTAAAVASGMIPLGEGGDAGGSIRIPAAWCNCFGFKAGLGSVPSVCRPDGWTATHPYCFNGGITKTVEDSAILFDAMNQYDPRDPISLPFKHTARLKMSNPIRGRKVVFTPDFGIFPVDPRIASLVEAAAKEFRHAGAIVLNDDIRFKHSLDELARCWCRSISLDTTLDIQEWKRNGLDLIGDHSDELTPEFIYWYHKTLETNIFDIREFNEIRTDVLDTFENAFKDADIIISPVSGCMPLKNSDQTPEAIRKIAGTELSKDTDFISFAMTFPINFVGYPAASIPIGFIDGLPVGMQIVARQYHDADVFMFAHAYEKMHPYHLTQPNI